MMMMMMMDHRPPLKLDLLILLLLQSTFMRLQGDPAAVADSHLECVNDFLFTINCSLSSSLLANTSVWNSTSWLTVTEVAQDRRMEYRCLLQNTSTGFSCSINRSLMPDDDEDYTETFADFDRYNISVCPSRESSPEICQLLEEEYTPALHVKPNAPCCLRVSHNSSRPRFAWKSTYEDYSTDTMLPQYLEYQLQVYKTGDQHLVRTHHINSDSTTYSVEGENFEPVTEYAAKVRSGPNMGYYQGQWSDWSAEVRWRTEAAVNAVPVKGFVFYLPVVFAVLCAVVVISLVGYGSVKKWRHNTFIPTPAPYFQTLYKDCQGDFKNWVVTQENTGDVLEAEESLQIDTLIECTQAQGYEYPAGFQQQFMENRAYSNIPTSALDADLLSMQDSDGSSVAHRQLDQSLSGYCQSCSPAQDSGCWLCSDTSLEKEPAWYCNEYCTLSCLQRAGHAAAGLLGDPKTNASFSNTLMEAETL